MWILFRPLSRPKQTVGGLESRVSTSIVIITGCMRPASTSTCRFFWALLVVPKSKHQMYLPLPVRRSGVSPRLSRWSTYTVSSLASRRRSPRRNGASVTSAPSRVEHSARDRQKTNGWRVWRRRDTDTVAGNRQQRAARLKSVPSARGRAARLQRPRYTIQERTAGKSTRIHVVWIQSKKICSRCRLDGWRWDHSSRLRV